MESASEPFRILVVCTGNICRSPLAERLLVWHLGRRLKEQASRVDVTSAGTRALTGNAIYGPMADVLAGFGASGDGFAARQVSAQLLEDAGLVLTATRQHRAAVVTLAPSALRRTFTLREFARLVAAVDTASLPEDPVSRLRALVSRAGQIRATVRAPHPRADDIDDPYGGPQEGYRGAGTSIDDAVRRMVAAL